MIKLYVLSAFEQGGGLGVASPGSVIEVAPQRAKHLLTVGRARLATAADLPKPRRKRNVVEASVDSEAQDAESSDS